MVCGVALDVRPEQPLPPGAGSGSAAHRKRKLVNGEPPPEVRLSHSRLPV